MLKKHCGKCLDSFMFQYKLFLIVSTYICALLIFLPRFSSQQSSWAILLCPKSGARWFFRISESCSLTNRQILCLAHCLYWQHLSRDQKKNPSSHIWQRLPMLLVLLASAAFLLYVS